VEVSGQLHAPAALCGAKSALYVLNEGGGGEGQNGPHVRSG
jgi:hypothetical protein